jgi:hypothetical protein
MNDTVKEWVQKAERDYATDSDLVNEKALDRSKVLYELPVA